MKLFPLFRLAMAGSAFALSLGCAAPASAQPAARAVLHRLGPDARQLRFEGEASAKSWFVYATAAEAETRARLRLGYSNAISVMPEASVLTVSVNGVQVSQSPIAAASDPGVVDVELPQGLLVAGYNTVRVAVSQRHRVDCSLEATYELWTQLDPAASGLTFPGLSDPRLDTLDDLAALSPDASGAVPLRIVLPDNATGAAIDAATRAAEAVAIRGNFARPVVETAAALDERPGLWVVAGVRRELAALGLANLADKAAGAPALVSDGGRVIVVASGADGAETNAAIEKILPPPRPDGRASAIDVGRRVDGPAVFPIAAETATPLKNFGVETEEFSGRLYRAGFDLLMPPDFYAADYDKLTLAVTARYAAGLSPGAQILVRVNDREAGSLPMRNPKGAVFQDRAIAVSLSALRPGLNHVVLEAQTPAPEDAACEVRSQMETKPRFVFSDDSQLLMPSLARVARMPDLAITLTSGFPYADDRSGHVFLARNDRATLAAAATFLTRTAVASRRLMTARATFDANDLSQGSALIFGALGDVPAPMLEPFGLDVSTLKAAWARPSVDESAAAPGAGAEVYDNGANPASTEQFRQRLTFRALYDRYINVHRGDFAWLRDPPRQIEIPDKATLLLAQARGPAGERDVWTLALAPRPAALARDMAAVAAPSNWNAIDARAAAFAPRSGATTIAQASNSWLIPTAAMTPGNLRLVAAGWLSYNLDYYLALVALAAAALGFATWQVVRAHGVRR